MSSGLFLQRKFEKKISPFFYIANIHTLKKERAQQMSRMCTPMGNVALCTIPETQTHIHSLSLLSFKQL